jgi:hypothetical protein
VRREDPQSQVIKKPNVTLSFNIVALHDSVRPHVKALLSACEVKELLSSMGGGSEPEGSDKKSNKENYFLRALLVARQEMDRYTLQKQRDFLPTFDGLDYESGSSIDISIHRECWVLSCLRNGNVFDTALQKIIRNAWSVKLTESGEPFDLTFQNMKRAHADHLCKLISDATFKLLCSLIAKEERGERVVLRATKGSDQRQPLKNLIVWDLSGSTAVVTRS